MVAMEKKPQIHKQFPKISRFITEYYRRFIAVLTIGFLFAGIVFQSLALFDNLNRHQETSNKQREIRLELNRLKGFTDKNGDYRDIYFKIASLEYELGNVNLAREYLKKTLSLDPNFKKGQVLGAKVGL